MSNQTHTTKTPLPMAETPESAPSAGLNASARGPKRLPHEGWMLAPLYVAEHHLFEHNGRTLLFGVGTADFFEIDDVVEDVLKTIEGTTLIQLFERLRSSHGEKDLYSAVRELREAEIVSEERLARPTAPVLPGRLEVSEIVLEVTTDSLSAQSGSQYLRPATGREAIRLLMEESGCLRTCSLTLTGEPLLNSQLTLDLLDHAIERAEQIGKRLRLAVVTNPRLVNERIRISLKRRGVDLVINDTAGTLEGVHGSGPASLQRSALTSSPPTHLRIESVDETPVHQIREALDENQNLATVDLPPSTPGHLCPVSERDLEELSAFVSQHVMSSKMTWIGPIEDSAAQVFNGRRASYGDSAGITSLAVGCDGTIYVSEEVIGDSRYRMGHIQSGLDQGRRAQWIREAHVDARPGCQTCWARHLCGGGSTVAVGNCPDPDSDYCTIVRRSYELAMGLCVDLDVRNPDLLEQRYGQGAA